MTARSTWVVRTALAGAVLCAIALALSAPALADSPDDRSGAGRRCQAADAGPVDALLQAPPCAVEALAADEPHLPLPPSEPPRVLDPGTILDRDLPDLDDLPELPDLPGDD